MPAQIHCHVIHLSGNHPHQLALGPLDLVMQAPQHPFGRTRVVVLDKFGVDPQAGEGFPVVTFQKKSTRILEHSGLQDKDLWEGRGNLPHQKIRSFSNASR